MTWIRKSVNVLLAMSLFLEQPVAAWAQQLRAPATSELRSARANDIEPGLVIVVEGIGGFDVVNKSAAHVVKQLDLPHELHPFIWSHGTGRILRDLQDTHHVLKKAEELAAFIKDYRARHPHRPIYVIGKSGGTGLVLFAIQSLPANTVERVILLSPAVSPSFDLRAALRATRRQVVVFYSRNDRFVLGWGTSQFGTIDRYYGKSAGMTAFTVPERLSAEDQQLYMRLVQVPWSARMLREGNTGSHYSTSMPWFLTSEVVPWLR